MTSDSSCALCEETLTYPGLSLSCGHFACGLCVCDTVYETLVRNTSANTTFICSKCHKATFYPHVAFPTLPQQNEEDDPIVFRSSPFCDNCDSRTAVFVCVQTTTPP